MMTMTTGWFRCGALAFALLPVVACAPNLSSNSYQATATTQADRTIRGTVISAQPVAVEGTRSGVGAGAGALIGGAAGSQIGGSAAVNIIGAVGGALLGGLGGAAIENETTEQNAMQYVVRTETGELVTVVQGLTRAFAVKQRVFVVYGSPARLIPDQTAG